MPDGFLETDRCVHGDIEAFGPAYHGNPEEYFLLIDASFGFPNMFISDTAQNREDSVVANYAVLIAQGSFLKSTPIAIC